MEQSDQKKQNPNRKDSDQQDDREFRSRDRRNDGHAGIIKFFLIGSGVLVVLIAAVIAYKFIIPELMDGGSANGPAKKISWKEYRSRAMSLKKQGHDKLMKGENEKSPKMLRAALSKYRKAQDELLEYQKKAEKEDDSFDFNVKKTEEWENLEAMVQRTREKINKFGGEVSGDTNSKDHSNNNEGDGGSRKENTELSFNISMPNEEDQKKLDQVQSFVKQTDHLLTKIQEDLSPGSEEFNQTLEKAESNYDSAVEIVNNLMDKYKEKNTDIETQLRMNVKFEYLKDFNTQIRKLKKDSEPTSMEEETG